MSKNYNSKKVRDKMNAYLTKTQQKKLDMVKKLTKPQLKELLEAKTKEPKKEEIIEKGDPLHAKIGIVSDTHLNNKNCKIDELHEFYNKAELENVDAIVHAGDMTEGINVYKGQMYELLNLSFDDQLKYVIDNYPKAKKINTYAISGNHDESRLKHAGVDFLKYVSKERPDIKNLGFYNNTIDINGIKIELQHGGGGSPYAISYHLQKYMDRMGKSSDTDVFVLGHYHRALMAMYRDMVAMLPGAFLGESLLAKRYKLGNSIMGWIVEIEKKEDGSLVVKPELIKY